jgi:hypothetical protein
MGQVIWAWGNVTEQALSNLFDGSDSSIQTLTTLISNGQLIEGSEAGQAGNAPSPPSDTSLQASIVRAFYAYTIPAAWSVSDTKAFVIDAGYPCGTVNPLEDAISDSVAAATYGCFNGDMYYLVYPQGASSSCGCSSRDGCGPFSNCGNNKFSEPPGLGKLDGSAYGGITLQDLITG